MHFTAEAIRAICLEEGADDAGCVDIGRDGLNSEQGDLKRIFTDTNTVISLVKQANRESIRSPSVTVADLEFAKIHTSISDTASNVIRRLNTLGIKGVAIPPGFPMDMTRWPGKVWEIGHKPVAVEAGMGHMGLNRLVIHPVFGNHIALDTILIDARLDNYDKQIDKSPCINCGLCIAVCPVGAISKENGINFMSCAMHNYHELFGGFQEWIEGIVVSKDVKSYRSRFRDSETMAKWQSITCGAASYRCSYCMAVCPAGEESVKTYESDKKGYFEKNVKPLKSKTEPVYVIAGTRAEKVALKNNSKEVRYVRNTIRPFSIKSFLDGVSLLFNAEQAAGLDLTLHFEFTGRETIDATIAITDGKIKVSEGISGSANLRIRADSETWVKIVNEEVSPFWAIISRKLRLKGNPANLKKFKACML